MPSTPRKSYRQRRRNVIIKESPQVPRRQTIKTKCTTAIKVTKLISAILVPLMIGAFTVITTVQESSRVQLQRDADMNKLERQIQLQLEVDNLKAEKQQRHDDDNANEIRIQNIYDAYMKEISSIVLKENKNITIPELLFVRVKTALTLEQIDARRKGYLIKFLYDSQLLYSDMLGVRYIDLAGTDLSNVQFGANKKFARRISLRSIRLIRLQLENCTFENVDLNQANFDFSALNNSRFLVAALTGVNFRETVLENSKIILIHLQGTSFAKSKLKSSFWSSTSPTETIHATNVSFSNCDLSASVFQYITFATSIDFNQANLEQITFIHVRLQSGTKWKNLNMNLSRFIHVKISNAEFHRCSMIGARFENSDLLNIFFDGVDLRYSQFDGLHYSGGLKFNRVNLNGSNLDINGERVTQITDSILPNGTFKLSYSKFGMNIIKNSNAEEGLCFNEEHHAISTVPSKWSQGTNIFQMLYNQNDSRISVKNYTTDWQFCFFTCAIRNLNSSSSSKSRNSIRQEINIEKLELLINARQVKFYASAYLGGFANDSTSTTLEITFRNSLNQKIGGSVGTVTDIDRQNQTAMLFWSNSGTIPINTVLIDIELKFELRKGQHALRCGMADNLYFGIQQK